MHEIVKDTDYISLFTEVVYKEITKQLFLSAREILGNEFVIGEGILISKNIQTTKGNYNIFIEYNTNKIVFMFKPPYLKVDIKTCYLFDEIPDFLLEKISEMKRTRKLLIEKK